MITQCDKCGIDCNKPPHILKKHLHFYCSRSCQSAAQTKRISKNCKICGSSFETRISDAHKFSTCGKACYLRAKSKEMNGNWQGGICNPRVAELSTKRYKEWRKSVFDRDNFTCVDCGKRGGNLEADHIKPWAYFPDLRFDLDNGATRCKLCHRKRTALVFGWRKFLISEGVLVAKDRSFKDTRSLQCAECSIVFIAKTWNARFCCGRCAGKFHQRILRRKAGKKEKIPMRLGGWSRAFEQCIDCLSTDCPYAARGRCRNCYYANSRQMQKGASNAS